MSLLARLFGRDRGGAAAQGPSRWVVVDTETSGLDPESDRLLAIGGVAVDEDGVRLDDSFEMVLRNEDVTAEANVVLHGIGHEAQRNGVAPVAALSAFAEWAADSPRVGFHADFDRVMLRQGYAAAGLQVAQQPWLDLAQLGPALAPETARYGGRSLDDWLAAFGIDVSGRHNAAGDALATAELLLRLRALAAAQGTRGFAALAKAAKAQKWLGQSD